MSKITDALRIFRPKAPRPKERNTPPARSQVRDANSDPFSSYYAELDPFRLNMRDYTLIRSQIPFLNVGILKLVKLINDPIIIAGNQTTQTFIDDYVSTARLTNFGEGLSPWLDELEDSAFETGIGWGEAILTTTLSDIHSLKICNPEDLKFLVGEDGTLVLATTPPGGTLVEPIKNPELIYYLAFDKRKGQPQGYPLLYSCLFPAQVFLRWEKSFDNQNIRFGDPPQMIMIEDGEDGNDNSIKDLVNNVLKQIATAVKYGRQGQSGDIGFVYPNKGNAKVQSFGHDMKLTAAAPHVRTMIEQLIANTGLMPAHLGVHWSKAESMSKIQSDLLQSNIRTYRKRLEPLITRNINLALTLNGYIGAKFEVTWPEVMLLDEKVKAEAGKLRAEQIKTALEALGLMIAMGWSTDDSANSWLEEMNIDVGKLPKGWADMAKSRYWIEKMSKELE